MSKDSSDSVVTLIIGDDPPKTLEDLIEVRNGEIENFHRSIVDMIDEHNPPKVNDLLQYSTGPCYRNWVHPIGNPCQVVEVLGRADGHSGWSARVCFNEETGKTMLQWLGDEDWMRLACGLG